MGIRALRIIVLILSALVAFTLIGIYSSALLQSTVLSIRNIYVLSIARVFFTLVFTVFYYTYLSQGNYIESIFIPLFLFFSLMTEYPTAEKYLNLHYLLPYSPTIGAGIFITGILMSTLSVTGYELFYGNHEKSAIWRYFILSLSITLSLAVVLPKISAEKLFNNSSIFILISLAYLISSLYCIVHIFTCQLGMQTVRHVFMLFMTISVYIKTAISNSITAVIVSTGLLIISMFAISVICRINHTYM